MPTRQKTETESISSSFTDDISLNVCVVIGEVIAEPVTTVLADGKEVTNCDVVTYTDEGRSVIPLVLVNVSNVPSEGDHICAVGFVRKRFFRAGASVQSRTEVVVRKSVRVRQKAQLRRLLDASAEDLLNAG